MAGWLAAGGAGGRSSDATGPDSGGFGVALCGPEAAGSGAGRAIESDSAQASTGWSSK
ncbi:hypothetical protein GCM10009681_04280 [Luedemannella helvata]|uniref:Uncharacterized protein n=1 Tax=Luedemannella helvata TaxID=349315 RepID=A0ABN2JRR2_9ACTN